MRSGYQTGDLSTSMLVSRRVVETSQRKRAVPLKFTCRVWFCVLLFPEQNVSISLIVHSTTRLASHHCNTGSFGGQGVHDVPPAKRPLQMTFGDGTPFTQLGARAE